MQLKAFQEQDPGTAARRGILLAHITYLNARVAVACRAAVDEGPARTGRKHVEHVEAGISAAVQTQRIVGILLEGKNIWRRCWLLT